MCSCDIGEYPEFVTPSRWVEARRVHLCDECGLGIQLGVLHRYGAGKFEGEFYEWRMCAKCDARRRAHAAAQATFGEPHCWPAIGELSSAISECGDENPKYETAFEAELGKLMHGNWEVRP